MGHRMRTEFDAGRGHLQQPAARQWPAEVAGALVDEVRESLAPLGDEYPAPRIRAALEQPMDLRDGRAARDRIVGHRQARRATFETERARRYPQQQVRGELEPEGLVVLQVLRGD